MKFNTSCNHLRRYKRIIRDIYSRARIFHLTAQQIISEKKRLIYNDNSWERCPRWLHSEIYGYDTALWENHYNALVWILPYNGNLYFKWDELPEKGKELYRTTKDILGYHGYKDKPQVNFDFIP